LHRAPEIAGKIIHQVRSSPIQAAVPMVDMNAARTPRPSARAELAAENRAAPSRSLVAARGKTALGR